MRTHRRFRTLNVPLLTACLALPAKGQGAGRQAQAATPQMVWKLSPDDMVLPISAVEWGRPDRWSVTSRYVHLFTQDRDHPPWIHTATVSLSPGSDGGRLGIGYQGIGRGLKPPLLAEGRVVLLRTWGRPLQTGPNRTFVGAELRLSFTGVVVLSAGHYWRTSVAEGHREGFWGLHLGVGI